MKLTALLYAARKLKEPVIFGAYFVVGLMTCLNVLNDPLGLWLWLAAFTLIALGTGANRAAKAANGRLMPVRAAELEIPRFRKAHLFWSGNKIQKALRHLPY